MYVITVFPGTVNRTYHPLPFRTLLCILIILVLALAAPVSAAVHTINPGDSIQTAINSAGDGDTIILNPGTYYLHDIGVTRNITVRANTSAGGSAVDTIIDAIDYAGIFTLSPGVTFAIDNLTLQNGRATDGGAIYAPSLDTLIITSSVFSNCSATNGGAIYSADGGVMVTSSTFSNCSANAGGAIYFNNQGILSVEYSTFSNCSAGAGGAIYTYASAFPLQIHYITIIIISSTFSDCTATGAGGAIYSTRHPDLTITAITDINIVSSTFTDCWGTSGGAIYGSPFTYQTAIIHYSRIYNDTSTPLTGFTDATDNWWGSNADLPHVSPWLVLGITATPSSITTGQTAVIRANLTYNSTGNESSHFSHVPDNIPVAFAITSGTGSLGLQNGNITSGANTTTFTPAGIGTSTISVTVDNQTVSADITVWSPGNTLNPGDSIQQNITNTIDGGTIILNPGTYSQNGITVTKNITIRANTSFGHSAADTIIDGSGSRIFGVDPGVTFAVDNLTLRNGHANKFGGGAIATTGGTVNVTSSILSNCSATDYGGAIRAFSASNISIRSSTFSHCSATDSGGAIYSDSSTATIMTSDFFNCSATTSGSAIDSTSGTATIHFSRIYNNTGTAVYNDGGTFDAANNWWGTNANPSGYTSGGVTVFPWLVLNITATPSMINTTQTTLIRINITNNSAGTDTTSGGNFVPNGIPIDFTSIWNNYAMLVWWPGTITAGSNMTTFIPPGPGTHIISATVDGQSVSTGIMVTSPTETSRIGTFRNTTHMFYLDVSGNGKWGSGDKTYSFGNAGDIPVTGDWNTDGKTEIGVFRNATHKFYLDATGNGAWGSGDKTWSFGNAGDIPVSGDWNHDSTTEIGVYRSSAHTFYLDATGNGAWGSGDKSWSFGNAGDLPVSGDWNHDGTTEIGVFRSSAHKFYLDATGNGAWGTGDKTYSFGNAGDIPVSGDWNTDGRAEIGVYRSTTHTFYLDATGNCAWGSGDKTWSFGNAGDTPVSGVWG